MSDDNFLSRWSRRKHEAKREPAPSDPPVQGVVPAQAGTQSAPPPPSAPVEAKPPEALPPLESLTPESDFAPFMRDEVNPEMRRAALKTLFQDPRFNVMDGLDVYIDDYSKPDPLPAGWLEKMRGYAALDDHKVLDPRPERPADDAVSPTAEAPKIEGEQPRAQAPEGAPSDTPDAGPKPPKLGQS